MLLKFWSQEKLEFRVAALDPPTGQYLREPFGTNDPHATEIFRVVAISPAREQNFQKQAVLFKAARRKHEAAISEGAIAPDITAGEQHGARVVVVTSPGTTSHHPNATKKEGRGGDYRRANAPPATHIEAPRLEQSFGLYLSLVQLKRDYNLKSSDKLNTLLGTK